jgi:hypothetical protein
MWSVFLLKIRHSHPEYGEGIHLENRLKCSSVPPLHPYSRMSEQGPVGLDGSKHATVSNALALQCLSS